MSDWVATLRKSTSEFSISVLSKEKAQLWASEQGQQGSGNSWRRKVDLGLVYHVWNATPQLLQSLSKTIGVWIWLRTMCCWLGPMWALIASGLATHYSPGDRHQNPSAVITSYCIRAKANRALLNSARSVLGLGLTWLHVTIPPYRVVIHSTPSHRDHCLAERGSLCLHRRGILGEFHMDEGMP